MSKKPSVKAIRDSVKRSRRRQLWKLHAALRGLLLPFQLAHLDRMRREREAKS